MAKEKTISTSSSFLGWISLIFAVFVSWSVSNDVRMYVTQVNEGLYPNLGRLGDMPNGWFLVLGLLAAAASWYLNGKKFSKITLVALTALVTSGAIWYLGIYS